jgi:hypothetical protein
MATLTNNINAQNIVDRFADYVRATANAGISWGTNAQPFTEFPTSYFGGTTAGKAIEITGTSIGGPTGTIVASTVYSVLRDEVNRYTRIRNLRARLNVTGSGGNTGSRPTPGIIYDQTAVAHMNSTYAQNVGSPTIPPLGPNQGGLITIGTSAGSGTGLEEQFDIFRAAYSSARGNTITITIDVCHASCHSSCHGARGRR